MPLNTMFKFLVLVAHIGISAKIFAVFLILILRKKQTNNRR